MDINAIRTIRAHNWKWSRRKAMKFAKEFIEIIAKKYPTGLATDTEQYFVLPGFEHVTKYQPIVMFNPAEGEWELKTTTKFLQQ